ncbi:MAG: Ribonuclease [Marmoricola sp.]|nr:Ribonuclease [Marmoricola sp.]
MRSRTAHPWRTGGPQRGQMALSDSRPPAPVRPCPAPRRCGWARRAARSPPPRRGSRTRPRSPPRPRRQPSRRPCARGTDRPGFTPPVRARCQPPRAVSRRARRGRSLRPGCTCPRSRCQPERPRCSPTAPAAAIRVPVAGRGRSRTGPKAPGTTPRRPTSGWRCAAYEAIVALPGALVVVSDSTYLVNCFKNSWWTGWRARGWINSAKKPVATAISGDPSSTWSSCEEMSPSAGSRATPATR